MLYHVNYYVFRTHLKYITNGNLYSFVHYSQIGSNWKHWKIQKLIGKYICVVFYEFHQTVKTAIWERFLENTGFENRGDVKNLLEKWVIALITEEKNDTSE